MPQLARISDTAPAPQKNKVEAILSSRDCVALMKFSGSISVAKWGTTTIAHYQHGAMLTVDRREVAEKLVEEIESELYPRPGAIERGSKFKHISKMLMVAPTADRSEESTVAKASAYIDDALNDIPAWAVGEAVRRWHRAECGREHNYSFAPSPGVLRKIALQEFEPALETLRRLKLVLTAAPSFADAEKRATASSGAVMLRPIDK